MARRSKLASMSIEALIKMRNEIGAVLSRKADALKKELASIGADSDEGGQLFRLKADSVSDRLRTPFR